MDDAVTALAYVVMALGLNIVVGFAGLLDLGYVAFFAIGAYTMGWLGSGFADRINDGKGVHIGVSDFLDALPGIHLNFLLVAVGGGDHDGDRGRPDRPADAAPAGRLHRDRHARVRRDHPRLRAERQRDHVSATTR